MNIQDNIKYNLKAIMKDKRLSLTDFSEELGIARSSLQQYLKCDSNPRADTLQLLADKLSISVETLISENGREALAEARPGQDSNNSRELKHTENHDASRDFSFKKTFSNTEELSSILNDIAYCCQRLQSLHFYLTEFIEGNRDLKED